MINLQSHHSTNNTSSDSSSRVIEVGNPIRTHQSAHHQALLQAAADGDLSVLELSPISVLQQARCVTGCTVLHWAAGGNHVHCVEYILQFVDVDTQCTGRASGRTALHYAARNGCITAASALLHTHHANPSAMAKHGVTPFQLAVFQNQFEFMQWFVKETNVDVAAERNDFGCGAVHWLAICPKRDQDLVTTAEWLLTQGCDFSATQKQGHSAFHKAAWMGQLELVQWLHTRLHFWDNQPDQAGNYAVDLAEMGKHTATAEWVRHNASKSRAFSCSVLGIPHDTTDERVIRQAYLKRSKFVHPDRRKQDCTYCSTGDDFTSVWTAYHHLTELQGIGEQHNPAHKLPLLLRNDDDDSFNHNVVHVSNISGDNCLKTRLRAVLLEFGEKGINVCNLRKKWSQVWPDIPFPFENKKLTQALRGTCSDVVEVRTDLLTNTCRIYTKIPSTRHHNHMQ